MSTTRRAVVHRSSGYPSPSTVEAYLPSNYRVTGTTDTAITVEGTDNAGWTLDGYVIPRLASGMIWANEWNEPQAWADLAADFWRDRRYAPQAYHGTWTLDRAVLAWIHAAKAEVPTSRYREFREVVRDAWPSDETWDSFQDGGA